MKVDKLLKCVLDIKLNNVFINYGGDGQRFSDIQLGDCGGAVPEDSKFAKESHLIGAGISRSPEVIFEIGWGTPTDIWSFGNAVSSAHLRPCFGNQKVLESWKADRPCR